MKKFFILVLGMIMLMLIPINVKADDEVEIGVDQEESNIEKNDIYNKELRDNWESTTIIYHGHSGYKKNISGEWYNSTKNDNAEATAILKEKDIPTDFKILSSDSKKYVSLICSAIKQMINMVVVYLSM